MRHLLFVFIISMIIGCDLSAVQEKKNVTNLMPADTIRHRGMDNLFQNWIVWDVDHPFPKDVDDYTDTVHHYGPPGFVFLPDSTIIENPRKEIRFGKISINGKNIEAVFNDGTKSSYYVKRITPKAMVLERTEKGRKSTITLNGDGYVYPDAKKNPFNILYSDWRIKPAKEEDTAALRRKIKQCVAFYIKLFNDNIQRQATDIDFYGIPTCFIWYAGGISVASEKHLEQGFIKCFYNQKQAFIARQMLEDVIVKKYKWDTNEPNWLKQTAPVLQQIYDNL